MKFKQSIFFLLFIFSFWCDSAFAYCYSSSAGEYCLTSSRYDCPSGCYCQAASEPDGALDKYGNGQDEIEKEDVIQWCSLGTACPWSDGDGQCGTSNNAKIYRCPSNYSSSVGKSTSISGCYANVPAGKYIATAYDGPIACPAGKACSAGVVYYGYVTPDTRITDCSGGYYSNSGASSCSSCPSRDAGYTYVNHVNTKATDCQERRYPSNCNGSVLRTATSSSAWGDAVVENLSAIAGYKIHSNGLECTKCGYGSYSTGENTNQSCTSCPSADSGWTVTSSSETSDSRTKCYEYRTPDNCVSGSVSRQGDANSDSYVSTVTLKSMLTANKGYYASSSATECTKCPTAPSGWSESTTSAAGSTSVTSCYITQTPANCKSGQVKKYATSTTSWGSASVVTGLVANPGYVAVSGSTSCQACPNPPSSVWTLDIFGDTGGTLWSYCKVSKTVDNCNGKVEMRASDSSNWDTSFVDSSSVSAKPGYYRTGSGNDVRCLMCPKGTISPYGQVYEASGCTACKTGEATNKGHTECVACSDVGKYIADDGTCQDCPSPYEGFGGENSLYVFTTNQDVNNKSKSGCAIKLNTDKSNCASGTKVIYTLYPDGSEGRYKYVRNDDYYIVASGNAFVKPEKDFPKNFSDDYCGTCEDGKYGIDGECQKCNNGYCVDENNKCVHCPAGHKCPEGNNNLQCSGVSKCSFNTYSEVGSSECTKCGVGYSTEKDGGNALCLEENGIPVACTSSRACIQIPTMLCYENCSCKNTTDSVDNLGPRARNNKCKSSLMFDDTIKVIKTYTNVVDIKAKTPKR